MDTPDAPAEKPTEQEPSPVTPVENPAPANAQSPAPAAEAPRRGRPPKSEAEKELTRIDRQIRLAREDGVPDDILARYQQKRDAIAATIPAKVPAAAKPRTAAAAVQAAPGTPVVSLAPGAPILTPAQVAERKKKLERTLDKTFGFVGEVVYTFTCDGVPTPEFPPRASEDLASAWVDIVSDYMPEHGESILKWALAVTATGKVAISCKREIDKHNESQARGLSAKKVAQNG